jgi:hypothetical protein
VDVPSPQQLRHVALRSESMTSYTDIIKVERKSPAARLLRDGRLDEGLWTTSELR